jgi:uncharacterized oligopeptide transporter (OPT) family protein
MPRSWMLTIGAAALGVLFLVVNDFIAGHMPICRWRALRPGGLVRAVRGPVRLSGGGGLRLYGRSGGLVGQSISGIGIIATLLMGVALLALHALVPAYASAVAGQMGIALVLFMVSAVLAMAAISNDNLQDLKTGYLVGATPWRQQIVLIIGCLVGALVIRPCWICSTTPTVLPAACRVPAWTRIRPWPRPGHADDADCQRHLQGLAGLEHAGSGRGRGHCRHPDRSGPAQEAARARCRRWPWAWASICRPP